MNSRKILVHPELFSHEVKYRKQEIKKYKYCKLLNLAFPERDNHKKNYIHKFVAKLKVLKDMRVTDLHLLNFLIDYFKAMKSLHKTIKSVNLPMARRYKVPGLLKKSVGRSLINMEKIDFSHEITGTLKFVARVEQINFMLTPEMNDEAKMFFRLFEKAKRWALKGSIDQINIFLKNMTRSLAYNQGIKLVINVTISSINTDFMQRIDGYRERIAQFDFDIFNQNIISELLDHLDPLNQKELEVLNLTPLNDNNEIVESVPDIFEKVSSFQKIRYLGLPVHFKDNMNINSILSKFGLPEGLKTLCISFRNFELSNNNNIEKVIKGFCKLQSLKKLDLYLYKISKGKINSPEMLVKEMLRPLKSLKYLHVSLEEHIPKMYDPVYEFSITNVLSELAANEWLEEVHFAVNKFNKVTLNKALTDKVLRNLRKIELDSKKEATGSSLNIIELLDPQVLEYIQINLGESISSAAFVTLIEKFKGSSRLNKINLKFKVNDSKDIEILNTVIDFIETSKYLNVFNIVLDGLKILDNQLIEKFKDMLKLKHPLFKGDFICSSHKITTQNSCPKSFLFI